MSGFEDASLITEFVAESREHLESIEPDLLAMEEKGAQVSQDIINRVFRAIHSIKGGAGFLAYEALKALSHTMENVLMQVRDGALAITPEMTDALLAGVDRLRAMLDDIEASDGIPYARELDALNAFLSNEKQFITPAADAPDASVAATIRSFDVEPKDIVNALAHGMTVYHVVAHPQRDLLDRSIHAPDFLQNIESVGILLGANTLLSDMDAFEKAAAEDAMIAFLFGTVLEPDLAALALELPPEQVRALDKEALRAAVHQDGERPITPAAPSPAAVLAPVEAQAAPEASANASEEPVRKAQRETVETLRVRLDLLTSLMNLAGELVLGRNQLMRALADYAREVPSVGRILQNINQVTTELQEGIMQTRMQPIGVLFNRYPRILRDMARTLNKEIEVDIKGAEVELDKSIIEMLGDPLTHIIRNCADHALEPPEEREQLGKSRMGHVQLRAYHEAGQVNIAITDDGRGIDPRKVMRKALEKNIITAEQAERMSDRELVHLIFAPGFSTAEAVTDVSGRGVGMDVVHTNIEKLGGHVEVESIVGQGATVQLRLPLTLAIISSLVVQVDKHRFAVPQVNLVELVWVRAAEVRERIGSVQGMPVLRLRGRLLPLVRLADVLGIERHFIDPETGEERVDRRGQVIDRRSESATAGDIKDAERRTTDDRRQDWRGDYNILVLQVGSNSFGLIVDALLDSEEIVVKPLSSAIKECRCFAGATILGDGKVIMILDALGIAEQAQLQFADIDAEERRRQKEEAEREAREAATRRSVIYFNNAPDEFFAVPQDKIMRLECVPASAVETIGSAEVIQYRGAGLPLIRLDRYLPVKPLPDGLDSFYIIIPKCAGNADGEQVASAGILVSRIVDAMDVQVRLEQGGVKGPGLEGSAIVNSKLTLFLDPVRLLDESGIVEKI